MSKFALLFGTSLVAFLAGATSQDASHQDAQTAIKEASARASIAFTGDVITSFQVKDVKAASKWYGEVLGCGTYLDLSEMGWCEMTTPVTKALIGLGTPEEGEPQTSGGARLMIGVEDLDAAMARLKAHGVALGEVVEYPGLVKLLPFSDPDGNGLMFHQSLQEG